MVVLRPRLVVPPPADGSSSKLPSHSAKLSSFLLVVAVDVDDSSSLSPNSRIKCTTAVGGFSSWYSANELRDKLNLTPFTDDDRCCLDRMVTGDTVTHRLLLEVGFLGVRLAVASARARGLEESFGDGTWHFLSLELERRVLRRSGSCRGCSNDCKEQSVARGDRDLDVEVDLLRLEEVVEEGALSVVLALVVSAAVVVVALRPGIVAAGEDGEVALDFLASSSARRGERRSMVMGRCEDVWYCEEIMLEIEAVEWM